ncbi:neuritin 1-like b [Brachyhypopomus gauderio]|uniref:neuritin 1-like b n=1 Tax=Brachyhypopomus gauderio TaxID=698409 RepID=UPI0040414631
MYLLVFFSFYLSLCCSVLGAAGSEPCSSVFRGFAECLVTLGDNVSGRPEHVQDIGSICRSWDDFQVCVSGVLSECQGDAADTWESLRAESRRTQFSGNLYELCASRTRDATLTPPHTASSTDETNQESLKGLAAYTDHARSLQLLLVCISVVHVHWDVLTPV